MIQKINSENAITVSELSNYIKTIFDSDLFLSQVFVEGEISNLKNSQGHLYFTLKDSNSQISCVMWKSQVMSLTFNPKDGDKVYAKGSVTLYPKSGKYQIYCNSIKEVGLGDLYKKFEELKKKLELKGYFSLESKKKLPVFPKCIALLTSKTGAVIEDLKSIILKRSQFSNLILFPTKVQGIDAKDSIIENIKKANEDPFVDVIILARGGGSIEDLWCFNEEEVAEAIHSSKKPIISAVGHETDFTISDFVSDLRAATPSDAALIVVRDSKDLFNELKSLEIRLIQSYQKKIGELKLNLDRLSSNQIFINPQKILLNKKQNILSLMQRLDLLSPENKLKNEKEKLNNLISNMDKSFFYYLSTKIKKYHILNEKLTLLNPLAVLDKGYSITFKDGLIVKSSNDLNVGDEIVTRLKDGVVISNVLERRN